jgi:phage-related tail fiber protein
MAILKNIVVDDAGFLKLPVGTTAQRPTAQVGMGRYNVDTNSQEWHDGNDWTQLIPAGAVRAFAMSTAPDGWLKCNGAAISRTTYSKLFGVIGTTWGSGDGSTTFNLPDLRGEFIRLFSSTHPIAGFQNQDWKGFYQTNTLQNVSSGYSHGPVYMGKTIFGAFTGALFVGSWQAPASATGTTWDASEMRPRNRAMLYCVKY